jgi:SnoaL-like domain
MKLQIVILLLTMISCEHEERSLTRDEEVDVEEIRTTIESTISWAITKDTTLLYSIIIDDSTYTEIHPSIRIVKGINNFKKAESFWLDERFKHVNFETWDMKINLSIDGSVAWFFTMLNDYNEWEGKSVNWENTRWTGILEKKQGKWRMMQMHFSVPDTCN